MSPSISSPVSDQYIREKLPLFQASLLAGLRDVRLATPQPSFPILPKELQIITNDYLDAIPPTHMLAVYASKSNLIPVTKTKVTLFPIHQIVLSAHCTNLPKLSEPICPTSIPVIPIALPSPAMYPYLQTYLYTKNIAALENFLLSPSLQQMDTTSLMRRLLAVHGLWGNACTLGVIDESFYAVIERAWALLHQYLKATHLPRSSA